VVDLAFLPVAVVTAVLEVAVPALEGLIAKFVVLSCIFRLAPASLRCPSSAPGAAAAGTVAVGLGRGFEGLAVVAEFVVVGEGVVVF
jgi:hypothetical protein